MDEATRIADRLGDDVEELQERLDKMPPVEPEKLRLWLRHSFRGLTGYAGLTIQERAILSVQEFEKLRSWALGRES